MRATTLDVGNAKYELRITWEAGEAIAKRCGMDPMRIATETQMAEAFAARGMPYPSKFQFDMASVFAILRCGIDAGDDAKVSDADLKQAILDIGLEKAGEAAIEYLSGFLRTGPSEKGEGEGDTSPGE